MSLCFFFFSNMLSVEGTAQSGQSRDASQKASLEELFGQVLCSLEPEGLDSPLMMEDFTVLVSLF